jgi:hypothetical protein
MIPELPGRIVAKVAERIGVDMYAVEPASLTITPWGTGEHTIRVTVALLVSSAELVDIITYDPQRS